jgi:hypothetical protein
MSTSEMGFKQWALVATDYRQERALDTIENIKKTET